MRFLVRPTLIAALVWMTLPARVEAQRTTVYQVNVTRVGQDMYRDTVSGAVFVTRYCYEYVYYQDALYDEGRQQLIITGSGTARCEVAQVLAERGTVSQASAAPQSPAVTREECDSLPGGASLEQIQACIRLYESLIQSQPRGAAVSSSSAGITSPSGTAETVAILKELDGDSLLISRSRGELWIIEKGVGCISAREGIRAIVNSPSGRFGGVGATLVLPDRGQSCRIWNAEQLG